MKLFKLDRSTLKGDIFGGITAGVVALPLALAFGDQSGMGAIYGLYGAMILGLFAAILGGTATQVSGPTGPMTVVSATVVAFAVVEAGSVQAGLPIIIGCFVVGGLFQIAMGLFGIGKAVRYVPNPVVSGFMTGIGCIIILFQIYPFLGIGKAASTIDAVTGVWGQLGDANTVSIMIGIATLAIIYIFPKISKAIPSSLIALVLVTFVAYVLKLNEGSAGIAIIGDVPSGFPEFLGHEIFGINASYLGIIIKYGFVLALLGAIDSLLTSVVADNVTKTRHDSNKELIGQGIGNTLSGLVGGLPGAGATMRTVINVASGGRTRLSGAIHGAFLLTVLLVLGPVAAFVPKAVLAGILISVGIGIIDYKGFRQLRFMPKSDAFILILVLVLTVFWNLINAVFIGIAVALVVTMMKTSELVEATSSAKSLEQLDDDESWYDDSEIPEAMHSQVYIKHINGPLFYGYAFAFKNLVETMRDCKYLIIRMGNVPYVDQSGVMVLEEALMDLREKGVEIAITGMSDLVRKQMTMLDIIPQTVEPNNCFTNFHDCANWLKNSIKAAKNSGSYEAGAVSYST